MRPVRRIAWLALLLPSCAGAPPAPVKPLRDFRGVLHVHSFHSHDSKGTFEEILAACRKRKIDFVCMTDHPPKGDPDRSLREGWRGLHDGVLFIQGHEYSDQLLGVGIRETVHGTRQEKIDAIHAQGGLAFVCHPEEVKEWDFDRFDGMEIWNTHARVKEIQKDLKQMGALLNAAKKDLEQAWLSILKRPDANLAKWDELNAKRLVVGIAGNDAHQNVNVLGLQIDPYDVSLGFVTTHVLAEELTEESVLAALKAGRVYVAFEFVAPADPRWAVPERILEATGEAGHGRDAGVELVGIMDGFVRYEATRDGKLWQFGNPMRPK